MSHQELTIIYELRSISANEVWAILSKKLGGFSGLIEFNDEKTTFEEILTLISCSKDDRFRIKTDEFNIVLSAVANCEHTYLTIETRGLKTKTDWDTWISDFYSFKPFVQAWVSDVEYAYWQNAHDPIQYKANNRSYDGLPMKSNGLPYPLEQQIIDISNNLGRRIFKTGFIEVVAAKMWFGDAFWQITERDKQAVLAELSRIPVDTEDHNGLLSIQAGLEPFTDSSDREIQDKLRVAVFG